MKTYMNKRIKIKKGKEDMTMEEVIKQHVHPIIPLLQDHLFGIMMTPPQDKEKYLYHLKELGTNCQKMTFYLEQLLLNIKQQLKLSDTEALARIVNGRNFIHFIAMVHCFFGKDLVKHFNIELSKPIHYE